MTYLIDISSEFTQAYMLVAGVILVLLTLFARQGIKRVGEPEEIASAVLFLTSPEAAWVTGQTLAVDGGFSTGMA